MAVIGILGGIVFVAIGNQRERSRVSSAFITGKSILPYAQECLFNGNNLVQPQDVKAGQGNLCINSISVWPRIDTDGCQYNDDIDIETNEGSSYRIDCAEKKIVCRTRNSAFCSIEDL